MDGIHDLGGMDGFGAVEPKPDEPVFHHSWEGRVFAMEMAMRGADVWNIDISRFGMAVFPRLSTSPVRTTTNGAGAPNSCWSSTV
jgi:nitrile hydratase